MGRLDRARDELQRAEAQAGAHVQTQLESIENGILNEEVGGTDQEAPGPKIDRVVEVMEKLDGLAEEAEKADVAERIDRAEDLLEAYLKNHPEDG